MTTEDGVQAAVIHEEEEEINGSAVAAAAGRSQATRVSTESDQNGADAADVRSGAKMKRFAFTYDFKMLLPQCVRQTNAQRAVHRKKDELFNKVREMCMSQVPSKTWIFHQHSSLKKLRESFARCWRSGKNSLRARKFLRGIWSLHRLKRCSKIMLDVKENEEGLRREKKR